MFSFYLVTEHVNLICGEVNETLWFSDVEGMGSTKPNKQLLVLYGCKITSQGLSWVGPFPLNEQTKDRTL